MRSFCHHCGRELDDDAMQCPECGTPTEKGLSDPNFVRKVNKAHLNKAPIGLFLLVAFLVAMAIIYPVFGPQSVTYDTTITVVEIGIDDEAGQLYTESGYAKVFLSIKVNDSEDELPTDRTVYWSIPTDGSVKTMTENNTITFRNTGQSPSFVMFLHNYAPGLGSSDDGRAGDMIDIYKEEHADREVEYFGTTGVIFHMSEVDENGYIILDGDSQPIGHLKLKISVDKA